MLKKIVVAVQGLVESLSKRTLRTEGAMVYSLEFGKVNKLSGINIPGSSFLEMLTAAQELIVIRKGVVKLAPRFIMDVFYVQFKGKSGKEWFYRANKMFVEFDGRKTRFYTKARAGYAWDVLGNCIVKMDAERLEAMETYSMIGATPSMLRKNQVLMGNVKLPWTRILNAITYGTYSTCHGVIMKMDAFNKTFSRMFQLLAPHKTVGYATCFAIYMGKWETKEKLSGWDGMMFIFDEFLAACKSEILDEAGRIQVTAASIRGTADQCRVHTAKAFGSVVSERFILRILSLAPNHRFNAGELTKEMATKTLWSDKYKNSFVVIGDGVPEYIADLNAIKAPFDLRKPGRMAILAVAKASQAYTDVQMLQKLAVNCPERFEELMSKLFTTHMSDLLDKFHNKEKGVVSFSEIKTLFLLGIVDRLAPAYVKKDKALFYKVVDHLMKGLLKSINLMRFKIDGASLRLFSDIAVLLTGQAVVPYGRFYSRYANQHFNKKNTRKRARLGTVIKHPSMGSNEFYMGLAMGKKELLKNISKLKCDEETKIIIGEWYMTLTEGVLVLPVSGELMKLLAGLDFDYDGAKLILDTLFNELLENVEPIMVDIKMPTKEVTEEREFKIANFFYLLKDFIKSDNKSVGEITNMNDALLTLLSMLNRGEVDEVKHHLATIVNTRSGASEEYKPLPVEIRKLDDSRGRGRLEFIKVVTVSEALIQRQKLHMTTIELTEESMRAMLMDMVYMFRYYQELTIDSVKTGIDVKVAFDVEILPESIRNYHIIIHDKTEALYVLKDKMDSDGNTLEDVVYIRGAIEAVKEMAIAGVCNRLNELLADQEGFTPEELTLFESILAEYPSLKFGISEMKNIYLDATRARITAIEDAGDNEEAIQGINELYKEQMTALASMCRRIFKAAGLKPSDRGLFIKAVSMNGREGIRGDGGNGFAAAVMPEEYVVMISDVFGDTGWAGSRLLGDDITHVDGDKIQVTNSMTSGAFTEDLIPDGKYTVKEFDGVLYAAKKVDGSLIVAPLPNEKQVMFRLHSSSLKDVAKFETGDNLVIAASREFGDVVINADTKEVLGRIDCQTHFTDGDKKVVSTFHANLLHGSFGKIDTVHMHTWKDDDGNNRNGCSVIMNVEAVVNPGDYFQSNNTVVRKRAAGSSF